MARSANYHGYTVFDDGTIPLSKRDHTPMFCFVLIMVEVIFA